MGRREKRKEASARLLATPFGLRGDVSEKKGRAGRLTVDPLSSSQLKPSLQITPSVSQLLLQPSVLTSSIASIRGVVRIGESNDKTVNRRDFCSELDI